MTQERGDGHCWHTGGECHGCYYCRTYGSEAEYYRNEWGGMDCPCCGKTLDSTGMNHEDGSTAGVGGCA